MATTETSVTEPSTVDSWLAVTDWAMSEPRPPALDGPATTRLSSDAPAVESHESN